MATTIPKSELRFRQWEQVYGPFKAGATTLVDSNTDTVDVPGELAADRLLDVFTKRTIVDAVEIVTHTSSGTGESQACPARLVNCAAGQGLAAAISASRFITASLDLQAATTGAVNTPTIDETYNEIAAGGRLGLDVTPANTPDVEGVLIKVRYREYEG